MRPAVLRPVLAVAVSTAGLALGQGLTLPPDGDNQKASVSQWIGPVQVTVTYHSPDVTGPSGEDRRGKIWGQLVPYGMTNLGWGSCGDVCPWRAGSNENTVISVSHPVLVEGKPLPAGSYGVHMIPGEREWTIIFSSNAGAWGSFFYDPAQDALRVTATPRKHEYTHWLTYEFIDRQPERATLALRWEELEVPWTIAVDSISEIYLARIREELTSAVGFSYLNLVAAAQYCVQHKVNLAEGLRWAQAAVDYPWVGQEDFKSLQILSRLQAANGLAAEADATLLRAVNHPTASVLSVHTVGRELIAQGRKETALQVFRTNFEKHPQSFTAMIGMVRSLAAVGRYEEALAHAEKALPHAPDASGTELVTAMIAKLKKGQDVN